MTNKAIILGSGFSKALITSMPLTNDLTNKIFDKIKETSPKKIQNLWKEHITDKGIGTIATINKEQIEASEPKSDFELILSYLDDAPWKDNITKYEHRILYEVTTKMISKIIDESNEDEEFFTTLLEKEKTWLKGFIKKIRDEKIPIITFNYDTILEWLLIIYEKSEQTSQDVYYKNDAYRLNYFIDTYIIKNDSFFFNIPNDVDRIGDGEGKNPPLLKLHGSKNWLYSDKRDSIIIDNIEFLKTYFEDDDTKDKIEEELKKLKKQTQILIIPPTQNKNPFYLKNDYIGQQWLEAREILSKVEELDIIGYSAPPTDISTNLMLQNTINRKDCKVNICYKDDDTLENRFNNILNLATTSFHKDGFDEEFCKKQYE